MLLPPFRRLRKHFGLVSFIVFALRRAVTRPALLGKAVTLAAMSVEFFARLELFAGAAEL
jgi:hypothetical protein